MSFDFLLSDVFRLIIIRFCLGLGESTGFWIGVLGVATLFLLRDCALRIGNFPGTRLGGIVRTTAP